MSVEIKFSYESNIDTSQFLQNRLYQTIDEALKRVDGLNLNRDTGGGLVIAGGGSISNNLASCNAALKRCKNLALNLSRALVTVSNDFLDCENRVISAVLKDVEMFSMHIAVCQRLGLSIDTTYWSGEMLQQYVAFTGDKNNMQFFMPDRMTAYSKHSQSEYLDEFEMYLFDDDGLLSDRRSVSHEFLGYTIIEGGVGVVTGKYISDSRGFSPVKVDSDNLFKVDDKKSPLNNYYKEGSLTNFDPKKHTKYSREATLAEYKFIDKQYVDIGYHDSKTTDLDGSGELYHDVTIGKSETHFDLSAGIYVTKIDQNGNEFRVFSPGIQAKIGGSYTAYEDEAGIRLGNDDLGLDLSGKLTIGEVAGDAELSFGVVDGELTGGLSLEGELNLVEVSGDVDLNLLGTKSTLGGSVSFGLGAHAKIGLVDGAIVYDVGASVGVGGSVYGTFEIGDALDKVTDGISDLMEEGKRILDLRDEFGGGRGALW